MSHILARWPKVPAPSISSHPKIIQEVGGQYLGKRGQLFMLECGSMLTQAMMKLYKK